MRLGLDAADVLELLAKAPDPASAARLTTAQVSAALKRAHRRHIAGKTAVIRAALRAPQLAQPPRSPPRAPRWCGRWPRSSPPSASRSRRWKARWRRIFACTRTLRSSCPSPGWDRSSAPGCWPSSAMTRTGTPPPRPARTTRPPARSPASPARRRPSWPGTCTTTGSATPSDRQAFCALTASPGARAYYDQLRARNIGHDAALRQLANRLVGILHGCLKTRTLYDETTAWPSPDKAIPAAA